MAEGVGVDTVVVGVAEAGQGGVVGLGPPMEEGVR